MARSDTEKLLRRQQRQARRAARREAHPNRRKNVIHAVVCVAVFAGLAVPAVFVNNVIGYAALFAFLVVVGLSALYLRVVRNALEIEEPQVVSSCVRGEELPFVVTLKNSSPLVLLRVEPSFFVSDLFGGEDSLTTSTLSLAPHETYDFDFDIRFDHIGRYTAGVNQVVIYDLLGLFSATVKSDIVHHVEVAPRIYNISGLSYDRELLKEQPESRTPISMDGSDYTGVRDYVIGDPMKSIHWKLSARSDDYYTKIFETLGTPGVEAILDFNSPAYDAEGLMSVFDAVVEGALSVGANAHANGMDFDLVYKDKTGVDVRISAKRSNQSRFGFLDTLPSISPDEHENEALELLRRESSSARAQRNIVVCSSKIDEQLVSALVACKQRRRFPILMAVVPPSMSPEERKSFLKPLRQLDAAGITHLTVSSADEMAQVVA